MAQKEVNKALARPLALVSGVLGVIQGLAWTIFSILCIFCYFDIIQDEPAGNHYYNYIYTIFLQQGNDLPDLIVGPRNFFIFMWFYFILSLVWLIESSILTWAMIREKWELSHYIFAVWSGLTISISVLDIILTGLLASDYQTVEDLSVPTEILVSFGIVMSMAARGYLLWVINVILAGFITKYAIDFIQSNKSETTSPIIYGYDTASIAPPWMENNKNPFSTAGNSSSPYYSNSAYVDDNKRPELERSASFIPAIIPPEQRNTQQSQNNSNFYYSPPISATNNAKDNNRTRQKSPETNKTAKIGNKGRRSPLNNVPPPVPPPVIPDPDYTPPGTPTGLKSVLRSKSNY